MANRKRNCLTTNLPAEVLEFLDEVAPGAHSKGKYLTGVLMKEKGRRDALIELGERYRTRATKEEWEDDIRVD